MKCRIFVYMLSLAGVITGSMLKCGEDILVQRGEKKTLRFWSTDDELMRVEVVPEKNENDPSSLFAFFKDSYSLDHEEPVKQESAAVRNENIEVPVLQSKEPLYRIDNELIENIRQQLLSRNDVSPYVSNGTDEGSKGTEINEDTNIEEDSDSEDDDGTGDRISDNLGDPSSTGTEEDKKIKNVASYDKEYGPKETVETDGNKSLEDQENEPNVNIFSEEPIKDNYSPNSDKESADSQGNQLRTEDEDDEDNEMNSYSQDINFDDVITEKITADYTSGYGIATKESDAPSEVQEGTDPLEMTSDMGTDVEKLAPSDELAELDTRLDTTTTTIEEFESGAFTVSSVMTNKPPLEDSQHGTRTETSMTEDQAENMSIVRQNEEFENKSPDLLDKTTEKTDESEYTEVPLQNQDELSERDATLTDEKEIEATSTDPTNSNEEITENLVTIMESTTELNYNEDPLDLLISNDEVTFDEELNNNESFYSTDATISDREGEETSEAVTEDPYTVAFDPSFESYDQDFSDIREENELSSTTPQPFDTTTSEFEEETVEEPAFRGDFEDNDDSSASTSEDAEITSNMQDEVERPQSESLTEMREDDNQDIFQSKPIEGIILNQIKNETIAIEPAEGVTKDINEGVLKEEADNSLNITETDSASATRDPTSISDFTKEAVTENYVPTTKDIMDRNEELKHIMSHLQTQEALLSQPLDGAEGPQVVVPFIEESDSQSLDIKLNILKNIIKGIASEIALNDRNGIKPETNSNLERTELVYPEYGEKAIENEAHSAYSDYELVDEKTANSEFVEEHTKETNEEKEEGLMRLTTESSVPDDFEQTTVAFLSENKDEDIETTPSSPPKKEVTNAPEFEEANSLISDRKPSEPKFFFSTESPPSIEFSPEDSDHSDGASASFTDKAKIGNKNKNSATKTSRDGHHTLEKLDMEGTNLETEDKASLEELYIPLNIFQDARANKRQEKNQDDVLNEESAPSGLSTWSYVGDTQSTTAPNAQVEIKDENIFADPDKHNSESPVLTSEESASILENIVPDRKDLYGAKVSNGDSMFGKETGSDNAISLIRNTLLDHKNRDVNDKSEENSIIIPLEIFNYKEDEPIPYPEPHLDQVEIKEQGSQVVIIKPHQEDETNLITTTLDYSDNENENNLVLTTNSPLNENTLGDILETSSLSDNPNNEEEVNSEMEVDADINKIQGSKSSEDKNEIPVPVALISNKHLNQVNDKDAIDKANAEDKEMLQILENYVVNHFGEANDAFPENAQLENVNENQYLSFKGGSIYDKLPQSRVNSKLESVPLSENLKNHRISEPLPYVLQTRKGLLNADAPILDQDNLYHRRDDSQQTFGGDSPFFIKLPGSPNAVPVFLQYEPVEIKYVSSDKYPKKKSSSETSGDLTEDEMKNDLGLSSDKNKKHTVKVMEESNNIPDIGTENPMTMDLHLRPDPFYLMDPPNLGQEDDQENEIGNENESVSVSVDGKLNFKGEEKVPAIVTGEKPIYPGEIFMKNPDNSYSASDTDSLTNPVFSLGSKVTRPPPAGNNPPYTPFPLTTNPPKSSPKTDVPNAPELEEANPLISEREDLESKFPSSTESPPSIEFSPIPYIDYPDSYGPFNYEKSDINVFDSSPNSFVSPGYPEQQALLMDIKEEENLLESPSKKDEDFDIVALANFLHQNQKVWSNPDRDPLPQGGSWRGGPVWDTIKYSVDNQEILPRGGPSPWETSDGGIEERYYSAFHSPEDVPGLDPVSFTYRKMPSEEREAKNLRETRVKREMKNVNHPKVEGILKFVESLPLPMQNEVLNPHTTNSLRIKKRSASVGEHVYCEWNIKTEPGLYLLVTFHNLSAPYTIDCYGAYIEVERENNGYDARWCGNRSLMSGTRPHVIFAKSEVRITVYDNGDSNKTHPTGFEADIEVIDLFDSNDYNAFIEKKATPKIRRLMEG